MLQYVQTVINTERVSITRGAIISITAFQYNSGLRSLVCIKTVSWLLPTKKRSLLCKIHICFTKVYTSTGKLLSVHTLYLPKALIKTI